MPLAVVKEADAGTDRVASGVYVAVVLVPVPTVPEDNAVRVIKSVLVEEFHVAEAVKLPVAEVKYLPAVPNTMFPMPDAARKPAVPVQSVVSVMDVMVSLAVGPELVKLTVTLLIVEPLQPPQKVEALMGSG